jgi:mRNA-degrading endonuclease toxin of MazEF toxin-antitoxin module
MDKKRLKERIGKIPEAILKDIEKALKIHLEL